MIDVFIGADTREPQALDACIKSISAHSKNYRVYPIWQHDVRQQGLYWRRPDALASTEFSITRFLVPWLAPLTSHLALFCDCDFIFTRPLEELVEESFNRDPMKCLYVVKHDSEEYWRRTHGEDNQSLKMDDKPQMFYPRKWWSALMLWDLSKKNNFTLTLDDVNEKPPTYLHRFGWLLENEIGEIPHHWHWLDGYSPPTEALPAGIHFTRGTPEHGGPWKKTRYASTWQQYLESSDN